MNQKKPESPEFPQSAEPAPPPVESSPERLTQELAELKDRHLRLAAEYDNFRKRNAKERAELWPRAQAELLTRIVDALDDLARFTQADSGQADAATLRAGVELVAKKFAKQLEGVGVNRIDAVGVPFDPAVHEAVMTAPAPAPAADHTIGAVLQAGYKLGDLLIRPARVQVLTWDEPRAREREDA